MKALFATLLVLGAAFGYAQQYSSFANVGTISPDISISQAGNSYTVSLANNATQTYAGDTYEVDYIIGFWVLSTQNITATNINPSGWSTNNNNAGSGGIAGWSIGYQDSRRIDQGESQVFTFSSFSTGGAKSFGLYVRFGEALNCPDKNGCGDHANEKKYIRGNPVPEPASIFALGLGASALLRRRLRSKK